MRCPICNSLRFTTRLAQKEDFSPAHDMSVRLSRYIGEMLAECQNCGSRFLGSLSLKHYIFSTGNISRLPLEERVMANIKAKILKEKSNERTT